MDLREFFKEVQESEGESAGVAALHPRLLKLVACSDGRLGIQPPKVSLRSTLGYSNWPLFSGFLFLSPSQHVPYR